MPELPGARDRIRSSRRVANPGCHASGFIALVAPLVRAGLLSPDAELSAFSLTGYTGGGKKMIAAYEAREGRPALLDAPRQYGLSQSHKHLPEMAKVCGLSAPPAFCPVVADFPCGMEVTVPVFARDLRGTRADVADAYRAAYPDGEGLVRFAEEGTDADGLLAANAFAGRDDMQVSVFGNDERLLLVSRFDNLGKGASGAAIQNMNIVLGVDETTGLVIG
jgi:N-acetyl-gamma-glutamyl-phosphate reductase